MDNFNLEKYLSNGVENLIRNALRATFENPRESLFIGGFMSAAKRAAAIRRKYEKEGEHIPPFLIASVTSQCNLHCAGCYARMNGSCLDGCAENQLTSDEWGRIFGEAEELGISFILLAGGEPLVRRDVIAKAALHKNIIFPLFTNGTLTDDGYITLFDRNRNLIPVISIEGGEESTDARRGTGVYKTISGVMGRFEKEKLLFGTSVTVTAENTAAITDDRFIFGLYEKGCRMVIYVEYVPVDAATKSLAPGVREREFMDKRIEFLRRTYSGMLFISFPGDEKSSGGCLAAGRGFFHINSHGGAEPCPFSPYSDTNIRNIPLKEALHSPLFVKLRSGACLKGDHAGSCVLFGKDEEVKKILMHNE